MCQELILSLVHSFANIRTAPQVLRAFSSFYHERALWTILGLACDGILLKNLGGIITTSLHKTLAN